MLGLREHIAGATVQEEGLQATRLALDRNGANDGIGRGFNDSTDQKYDGDNVSNRTITV